MSSKRRILASRANGARSSGPVTDTGKSRSARNSTRHGLLAKIVVLDNESPQAFQALLEQHLDRFAPADGVEYGIVEEMVAAFWRIRRAWAVETATLDKSIQNQPEAEEVDRIAYAFSGEAEAPRLALLHRYETRLHRIYQRALHNLLLLGKFTLPNEPSPISGHPGVPSPPLAAPEDDA